MFEATVAGNLGRDAELKSVSGTSVLNFSVAASTGFGQSEQTNWVSCALWGKRGESLAQYLTKGTSVVCTGEVSTREHDGKTYLQMRVYNVKLMGGKAAENAQAPQQQQQQQPQQQQYQGGVQQNNPNLQQAPQPSTGFDEYKDDIPF